MCNKNENEQTESVLKFENKISSFEHTDRSIAITTSTRSSWTEITLPEASSTDCCGRASDFS